MKQDPKQKNTFLEKIKFTNFSKEIKTKKINIIQSIAYMIDFKISKGSNQDIIKIIKIIKWDEENLIHIAEMMVI